MTTLPVSDAEFVLLHNPRCSKSRAARALLDERGIAVRERLYLEEPLSPAELRDLARRLGEPPSRWLRRGEATFREAGLADETDDAAILAAMAHHPVLIERPILVRGARAIVGRPPGRVLELL